MKINIHFKNSIVQEESITNAFTEALLNHFKGDERYIHEEEISRNWWLQIYLEGMYYDGTYAAHWNTIEFIEVLK